MKPKSQNHKTDLTLDVQTIYPADKTIDEIGEYGFEVGRQEPDHIAVDVVDIISCRSEPGKDRKVGDGADSVTKFSDKIIFVVVRSLKT